MLETLGMLGWNGMDKAIKNRGPRFAVVGEIRRDEFAVDYADTAAAASTLAEQMRERELRQVKIIDPAGVRDLDELAAYGRVFQDARRGLEEARAVLRAAVLRAYETGFSESEIARTAGVDRMTVRKWLGKR